jgi:hypothetical protein
MLVASVLIGGCAANPAAPPAKAPGSGGMGGGMSAAPSDDGMAQGVVADSDRASIDIGSSSRVSSEGVLVARVVAPSDGWVVVDSALGAGRPLGITWVPEGESREVLVKLTAANAPRAVVSLHVDRGKARVWEYDPLRPGPSRDARVLVDRTPVAVALELSSYGSEVLANSALVRVEDQPAGRRAITVAYLLVPGPSWVSVMALKDGLPSKVLGKTWRAAGEYQQIEVPLDEPSSPGEIDVTVHLDAGIPRRFEFNPADPLGSTDQPLRSAGEIVSKRIQLTR